MPWLFHTDLRPHRQLLLFCTKLLLFHWHRLLFCSHKHMLLLFHNHSKLLLLFQSHKQLLMSPWLFQRLLLPRLPL